MRKKYRYLGTNVRSESKRLSKKRHNLPKNLPKYRNKVFFRTLWLPTSENKKTWHHFLFVPQVTASPGKLWWRRAGSMYTHTCTTHNNNNNNNDNEGDWVTDYSCFLFPTSAVAELLPPPWRRKVLEWMTPFSTPLVSRGVYLALSLSLSHRLSLSHNLPPCVQRPARRRWTSGRATPSSCASSTTPPARPARPSTTEAAPATATTLTRRRSVCSGAALRVNGKRPGSSVGSAPRLCFSVCETLSPQIPEKRKMECQETMVWDKI